MNGTDNEKMAFLRIAALAAAVCLAAAGQALAEVKPTGTEKPSLRGGEVCAWRIVRPNGSVTKSQPPSCDYDYQDQIRLPDGSIKTRWWRYAE
jgi:hypothetical protein